MRPRKRVSRGVKKLWLLGYLLAFTVEAEQAEEPRRSLDEFVAAAERQGFQLGEQRAKIQASEAREDYARSKAYPTGTLESLFGPIPGASGNAIDGRTDWDDWNVFSVNKLELSVPIYAFGSLQAGRDAASAGTLAERELLERERWQLRTQVTEFYYGYQLAFELSEVASSLEEKLEKAVASAEKSRKISRVDLDKLKSYLTEVQVRKLEANKGMTQTRMAMAWKIGTYGQSLPRWDRANLIKREAQLKTLAQYQELMKQNRPELKALEKELVAKDALVRVEEGQFWPTLFVGGRLNYAVAPNREPQRSPFANDTFNTFSGGVGVGLRWNLGFGERAAKIGQARAELIQADFKKRHLAMGMLVEVEKNYLDLLQSEEVLKMRVEAAKSARALYQDSLVAFGLGTGGARNLLENLGTYALSEKGRFEALYAYNLAYAKLEQSVGTVLR